MAYYKTVSWDEVNSLGAGMPSPDQTRLYNMMNRGNASNNDNFFQKRAKSLENALGTTGAVIAGGIDVAREDAMNEERGKRFDQSMKDIYKNAGYENADDYYDAKDAAEKEAFGKIGFDIDSYWNQRADADIAGDKNKIAELDNSYNAAKAQLVGEDAANIARFDEIQNNLKNQSTMNVNEQREAQKNWENYRKNSYIGQKTNQDRGKFLGSAINTLSTAFDVMAPGAGVLVNSVQGGIEGVADELEQNGLENFDLQRAGQNALIGATTGAVTGGLNKGISNQLAKNGGNLFRGGNAITRGLNNLGSSTTAGRIGSTLATGAARGALSGAVGGATGAGLSAALNGQDVLGSAIQGAQQGFGQGALAGGVMAGAGLAKNGVKNAIMGQPETKAPTKQMLPTETEEQNVATANTAVEEPELYPAFEPGNDRIKQRNKLQSVGEQLQTAAKTQKYSALYDSLDGKTASRAVQTGAPDKLASLGVKPENYLEAAKTSDYVNEVVDKLAKDSGIKAMVPDLPNRLSADNMDIVMSPQAAKKYDDYVKQIVADGSTPDEYSAGYLLQKSRELGKKAVNLRGNTDDVMALRSALTEAKYTLRDIAAESLANADITSDLTNEQIALGLAKKGANKQIQDYYTQTVDGKAPTVRDYIARSALFEQGRDMGSQIEAEKYTRSASKAPTNPLTRIYNASGLEQPINTVLRNTVAPVASGITKLAGKAIEGAGNLGAMAKNAVSNVNIPEAISKVPVNTGNVVETAYNPATRVYEAIGRTEGLTNAEQARTADYLTKATQEVNAAQGGNTLESIMAPSADNGTTSVYNSVYGGDQNTATQSPNSGIVGASGNSYFPATGDYWTDILANAMTSAIDSNDVNAFAALYGMYQDSLSNLQKQSSSTSGKAEKLTDKQRQANAASRALNDFESAEPNFAYDVSDIPVIGAIANIGGNDYGSKAEALALQIGYMLSGATVNREEAKKIGMAYVPQPRDNEVVRQNKINQIRGIISDYQQTYSE